MTTFVKRIDYPMDGVPVAMLVAADRDSHENIQRCKRDVTYRIVPKRDNNADFHRKVMRLLRDLYENQEQFDSEDVHREYVKLQCGWVHEVAVPVAEHDRLANCAEWLRSLAKLSFMPDQFTDSLFAAAGLIEGCTTHYVTKPLSFDKCDQDEREEFLELLKPYYAEQLGEDALRAYEGF